VACIALYAADSAFLAGVVMAPIFFSMGQPSDALIALAAAVGGAAFSMYQGQPWPGWAFLKYWRRYL
jgi:hypothetical protein